METFYCEGKRLANYLIKHGSKLIRIDHNQKSREVFIFEKDSTIDENLKQWEIDKKKCLF